LGRIAVGDSYTEVFTAAEKQGVEVLSLTMQVPGMEDIEAIV